MKRVTPTKATPKERDLDLINNKIASSQKIVDDLRDVKSSVEKNIKDSEVLTKKAIDNKLVAEKELGDIQSLLSEGSKELDVLGSDIRNAKSELSKEIDKLKQEGNNSITERNNISTSIEAYKIKFADVKKESEYQLSTWDEEYTRVHDKVELAKDDLHKLKMNIEEEERELDSLDVIYADLLMDIENSKKMKVDLCGQIDDLKLESTGLNEKKLGLLEDIRTMETDLEVIQSKSDSLLKKSVEIKEGNVKLAERESVLDQKEQKINELYKRAGINL